MILALIVMFVNRAFFTSGFRSLFQGAPNMDALVALGSGVSFLWSLSVLYKMTYFAMQGESIDMLYRGQLYFESAAMIPALITVGKLLESLSKGRTTDALKGLMKLAPETANIERDGMVVTVGISEVKPGDIFVVKPGESIPVDGENHRRRDGRRCICPDRRIRSCRQGSRRYCQHRNNQYDRLHPRQSNACR
ncbi:MAG: hypothetical protein LKE16_05780 [Dialister sp.]|jgi:Cu2+-exporting ATPase|nr:hypothetical protein [Dialister sp.]